MDKSDRVKLVVPASTVISVIAVLLGLWVLYQVRDIVLLFIAVVAIVVILSPIIRSLQKSMPRTLAIVLVYALLVALLLLITGLMIPPIVAQLSDFLHFLERVALNYGYSETTLGSFRSNIDLISQGKAFEALGQFISQFRGSLGTFYSSTVGLIGSIVAIVTVFISSFYLLLEEKNFHEFITSLIPPPRREEVSQIIEQISEKMGAWLRGQLALMVIVGGLDGIALAILGVPYPLLLALWAGLTEIIPFAGPFIGAIPGVFLAFTTLGLAKGLIAILIYIIVQQLESNIFYPRIMGKALGLSPVIIIFALLAGGKLFGLVGVIIAVPVAAALSVVYEAWWPIKRDR